MNMGNVKLKSAAIFLLLLAFLLSARAASAATIGVPTNYLSMNTGLVGYWTFDGKDTVWTSATAATTLDKSGNGNTGTLTNMSRSSSPVSGKIGQGLNFDGGDDYVSVPHNSILNPSAITISFWANMETVISSNNTLIEKNPNTNKLRIRTVSNKYQLLTNAATNNLLANTTFSFGKWEHWVFSGDGSGLKLYRNGILDNSNSTAYTAGASSGILGIGGIAGGFFANKVKMDDVRIYNRALSATEIKNLYNAGAAKLGVSKTDPNDSLNQGLVGHWTMDGADTVWTSATAATTLDKSGNGNTGTLTNMSRSSSPVSGKIGQGLNFDGGDDYIIVNSNPISSYASPSSVCAWVNPADLSPSGGTYRTVLNFSADANNYLRIAVQSSGNLTIAYTAGGTSYGQGAIGSPIKINLWKYVCSVFDGSALSVYINGVSEADLADSASNGSVNRIGVLGGIGFWSGLIDDVRVYNRALSVDEIIQLYNLGR